MQIEVMKDRVANLQHVCQKWHGQPVCVWYTVNQAGSRKQRKEIGMAFGEGVDLISGKKVGSH